MSEMTRKEAIAMVRNNNCASGQIESGGKKYYPQAPVTDAIVAAHAQGYAAGRESLVPLLEQAFDALECAKPSILKQTYPRAMKALEAALKEIKP